MFSKKYAEELKDKKVASQPILPAEIVSCHDCKHLLYKPDAQVVWEVFTPGGLCRRGWERAVYYCPACRKPYDCVEHCGDIYLSTPRFFRIIPAVPATLEPVVYPTPKKKSGHKPIPTVEV